MKTTLLLSFLFVSLTTVAQSPISSFYTPNTSGQLGGGITYTIATSSADLNESVAGANLVWNFSQLTEAGSSITETVVPTTNDVALYPNTNALVHTVSNFDGEEGTNDIFLSSTANGASITGVDIQGVILNYITNNGFIGLFPLNYGYASTDTVAGTFNAGEYSGTFTGSLTATVDAYGTLTANLGSFPASTAVTRLKVSQQLSLSYLGFPVGTLTQTTYSYYNGSISSTDPIFRSMTTHVVVALLNIDDTTSTLEVYEAQLLGDKGVLANAKTVIAPNPVADVLHFSGDAVVTGVTITDFSGRTVLQSKSSNDISVNNLSAGIYNVAVQTNTGVTVQKMVKQ